MSVSNDDNNCMTEQFVSRVPPWHEKRLPFIFTISLELGSTMFDYSCIWNKNMFIFEVGILWFHIDIYFKKI